jgi:O-antigen ligase
LQIKWIPLPAPWHNRVVLWAICLFAAVLPFQLIFPPITAGIVAVCLAVVLRWRFNENLKNWRINKLWRPWPAMYALLLLGLIYTPNPHEAGRDVMLKISMLLLPLSFAALPRISEKNRRIAIWTFAGSLTLAGLIAMGRALWWWMVYDDAIYFSYNNFTFSKFVSMHYFALYVGFALVLVLGHWFENRSRFSVGKQFAWLLWALFFILLLVVLSVRMQFLAVPLTMLVVMGILLRKTKRFKEGLLVLVAGGILFSVFILSSSNTRTRLRDMGDEILSLKEITNEKQTNPRKYIWEAAATIVRENWLWGTGTGASDDLLQAHLASCDALFWDGEGHYTLQNHRYNYHNEFLQHFATHGIGGFLFLMAVFLIPLGFSDLRNDYRSMGFLTLCGISFLTESMLERQAGVLFFSFFYGLMIINRAAGRS